MKYKKTDLSIQRLIARFSLSDEYVPRRNFHESLYKQNIKWVRPLFYNNHFRHFFFKVANLLYKKEGSPRKIAQSIYYRLSLFQQAPEIQYREPFSNMKCRLIDYGYETRPSLITKAFQSISTTIDVKDDSFLWTGIAILENAILKSSDILKSDIHIKITIEKEDSKSKELYIYLPVDKKKHGIAHREIGENWTDFMVDLKDYKSQKIKITLEAFFRGDTFFQFNAKEKEIINHVGSKCIAWSSPQVIIRKKINCKKNILLIAAESLTDPFWMRDEYQKDIKIPNLDLLASTSTVYKRAYSQADSTLPYILSMQTGLFPSQHHFGDYSKPIYAESPSASIKFISELLKIKGFTTSAYTAFPRFDTLYGWSRGYDSYFHANLPSDSNAPDAGKIIRHFDMMSEQDCFIYAHLTRLHGPLTSFDHLQTPRMHNAEIMSEASKRNFLPLYFQQLFEFDRQIGEIISFLKLTKQYDNTLIVLTGDHGVSMSPWWKDMNEVDYAHYEQHARVPLILKSPNWSFQKPSIDENPKTAHFHAFKSILSSLNIDLPDYYSTLPQNDDCYSEYAISETVYHPKKNNYAVTFVSKDYKYWCLCEVDWNNCKLNHIIEERLFKVNETGHVNEEKNLYSEKKDVIAKLQKLAISFFEKNIEFRKKYNTIKFPNNLII
jgi:hypothetical protein